MGDPSTFTLALVVTLLQTYSCWSMVTTRIIQEMSLKSPLRVLICVNLMDIDA